MTVDPNNWPEASTFFESFANGAYDAEGKLSFLYRADQVRESEDGSKLYIGRAGVDGVEFVYLKDAPSIWAWYPLDGELTQLSDTIDAFVRDWPTGKIKV